MTKASLGWAILGTGAIARRFAGDMRLSRRGRVLSVASGSPERAERLAGAIGPHVWHGDIEAVLRRPDIGAAYVAGRNEDHCALALRCLGAGKAVMVEKPFATSAAEAALVADAARQAGLLAMEAMWMRFTPGIRRLKALADRGAVGTVRAFEASLLFDNPSPPAGALLDLGVYPVSLALHLMGHPSGVTAAGSAAGDRASLILDHGDALATLTCGFVVQGPNIATLTGDAGILATDGPFLCPAMLSLRRTGGRGPALEGTADDGLPASPFPSWLGAAKSALRPLKSRRFATLFSGTGLQYQADHFAECLAAGLPESPIMPLADSVETLRIVGAAQEAIARRQAAASARAAASTGPSPNRALSGRDEMVS